MRSESSDSSYPFVSLMRALLVVVDHTPFSCPWEDREGSPGASPSAFSTDPTTI